MRGESSGKYDDISPGPRQPSHQNSGC